MTRFDEREMRRASRMLRDSRAVLVEALQHMQTICPPRVTRQSRDYLQRVVNGALYRDDCDPLRSAMQRALADARASLNRN